MDHHGWNNILNVIQLETYPFCIVETTHWYVPKRNVWRDRTYVQESIDFPREVDTFWIVSFIPSCMGYANCKHFPQTSPIYVGPVTAMVSHTRAANTGPVASRSIQICHGEKQVITFSDKTLLHMIHLLVGGLIWKIWVRQLDDNRIPILMGK